MYSLTAVPHMWLFLSDVHRPPKLRFHLKLLRKLANQRISKTYRGVMWLIATGIGAWYVCDQAKHLGAVSMVASRKIIRPFIAILLFSLSSLSLVSLFPFLAHGEVSLEGLEVTQSVQIMSLKNPSVNNTVPLIADKKTVVRAYFSTTTTTSIKSGKLQATHTSRPTGESLSVGSINQVPVPVDPAENRNLSVKRECSKCLKLEKSLNFLLTPEKSPGLTAGGILTLMLKDLMDENGRAIECNNCTIIPPTQVSFRSAPPLRIRLIGFKLKMKNGREIPHDYSHDFKLIRSWLQRAYPVARVISVLPDKTELYDNARPQMDLYEDVDGDNEVGNDGTCLRANAQVQLIRDEDLPAELTDPRYPEIRRTHYYGVIHDGGDQNTTTSPGPLFITGCADIIPDKPNPDAVASGPTGPYKSKWDEEDVDGWDSDGVYGDWMAGHELGHTFGRWHLQGGCTSDAYVTEDNYRDPTRSKKNDGTVSSNFPREPQYVELDVGDESLNIPMRVIPGDWKDVMTYCRPRWISPYTYIGILERLESENGLIKIIEKTALAPPSTGRLARVVAARCTVEDDGISGFTRCLDENRFLPRIYRVQDSDSTRQTLEVEMGDFLSVVAIVNTKTCDGQIQGRPKLQKVKTAGTPVGPSQVQVRLTYPGGTSPVDHHVEVRRDKDVPSDKQTLGLVKAVVPVVPGAQLSKIELVVCGAVKHCVKRDGTSCDP